MTRFEVQQDQDDLWSVSHQGSPLYVYPTEEEARWAALMLASDTCLSGTQASVVITPPAATASPRQGNGGQHFTGM